MKSILFFMLAALCFVIGCGSSNEVVPYEGEVTTPPALDEGGDEAVPAAPGLVD